MTSRLHVFFFFTPKIDTIAQKKSTTHHPNRAQSRSRAPFEGGGGDVARRASPHGDSAAAAARWPNGGNDGGGGGGEGGGGGGDVVRVGGRQHAIVHPVLRMAEGAWSSEVPKYTGPHRVYCMVPFVWPHPDHGKHDDQAKLLAENSVKKGSIGAER